MSFLATTAYGNVSQWKSSRRANSSELSSIGGIGRLWILSGRKKFWRICGGGEVPRGRNGNWKARKKDAEMPALRERSQSKFLQSGNVTVRQFPDRAAGNQRGRKALSFGAVSLFQ